MAITGENAMKNTTTLYSNGNITMGMEGAVTVSQKPSETAVYKNGQRIAMPRPRYALSADQPLSGQPGRAEFESDLRSVLAGACGREYAAQLIADTYNNQDGVSPYRPSDDIADGDYQYLRSLGGDTGELERIYRAAFNAAVEAA
jgi:hypothetical protein